MKRLVFFVVAALAVSTQSAASPPSAIIYVLHGDASWGHPGQPRRPLQLFDCLPTGAVVTVGQGSSLALAFASGRRWILSAGAQATIARTDLTSRTGDVRPLPEVPPLPQLAPVRREDRPGPRAGAVRIRGEGINGLYPSHDTKALANAAVLRFQLVDQTTRYKVEVQDGHGAVVFSTETAETAVKVPAGLLRPGTPYHWVVRTLDRPLAPARGEADLSTVDGEAAQRREKLRRATAGDRDLLPLLAALDLQLGLLAEARDELREALQDDPTNTSLASTLAGLEQKIEGNNCAQMQ